MRPALALLFAATTWATTCGVLPPCAVLAPDLTVAVAEVIETPLPSNGQLLPVRMKLRTLIYGPSPGKQFTFFVYRGAELQIGALFYMESRPPLQSTTCDLSGPYSEGHFSDRIRDFRNLARNPKQPASFLVHARSVSSNSLPGVQLTLHNSSHTHRSITNIEGDANWQVRTPGRYALSAAHSGLQVDEPQQPLAPVDLLPGSCTQRYMTLLPPYSLNGSAHTQDNRPAVGLPIFLRDDTGASVAETIASADGAFTIRHIPAGGYTLYAGDTPGHRSPYSPYLYPGVATETAATTIKLGPGHQAVPLQLTVPNPAPVRTIHFNFPRPLGPKEVPILSAGPAPVYSRSWSSDRTTYILTIPPMQPFTGSLRLFPSPTQTFEFSIPIGTEPVTRDVRLQLAK